MRIIAGEHKGRTLKTLKGDATRPTTDRVKESLMSGIASAHGGFEGLVVLDAFAGSGSLGLEALSRGAARCVFCESARAAQQVVQANIDLLRYSPDKALLLRQDMFSVPYGLGTRPFDLVFLDPPYATSAHDVAQLVSQLDQRGLIADAALVCYEHDKKDANEADAAFSALKWQAISSRTYGDTRMSIIRKVR